ncbi:hypothetical protein NDN08_002441 [Rhodosorus marinus]|uniref:Transcriptional adapter n=1 Tax=Rhodosorus marinus TaxID=101924 RepID=A0AAV8UTQ7_9RHOD|nr:hypothetical protein NDN08_002441 [Rhodosorus marinus]
MVEPDSSEAGTRKRQRSDSGTNPGCAYCRRYLRGVAYIQCSECSPKLGRYCVDCFSVAAHVLPHQPDHSYRVVSFDHVVVSDGWTAPEELLLLDALLDYGVGNWEEVAEVVGTKTRDECSEHYETVYMEADTFPLRRDIGRKKATGERKAEVKEARVEQLGEPLDGSTDSTKHGKLGVHHELSGYYPNRQDFDVEWDDSAEAYLADMSIDPGDTDHEKDLKLRLIDVYQRRLNERELVKDHVFERGLLDFENLRGKERRMHKEERVLSSSLQVFSRLQSQEEHEVFTNAMLYEHRLLARLFELAHYRSQGLKTVKEADVYEADRRRRVSELQLRKAKEPAYRTGLKSYSRGARYLHREKHNKEIPSPAVPVRSPGLKEQNVKDKPNKAIGNKLQHSLTKGVEPPLAIEGLPGYEELHPKEREICSLLRIHPQTYADVKDEALETCRELARSDRASTTCQLQVNLSEGENEKPFRISAAVVTTENEAQSNGRN